VEALRDNVVIVGDAPVGPKVYVEGEVNVAAFQLLSPAYEALSVYTPAEIFAKLKFAEARF
jgi:hypothetical protein